MSIYNYPISGNVTFNGNLTSIHTAAANLGNNMYTTWAPTPPSDSDMKVECDLRCEGNVFVKGKNLNVILEKFEDRLAIISDPDPKKQEQFAALKEAYDNYRLIEKLVQNG